MLGGILGAIGSIAGGFFQKKSADKQAALQRQFAQHGIRWKVADAKKAGIHPLYALGAQTTSYQPVQAGDLGLSQAGQDIGRAVDAGLSAREKATPYTRELANLSLERARIQNQILKAELASQVARLNQPGRATPFPVVNNTTKAQEDRGILTLGGARVYPHATTSSAEAGEKWGGEPGGWMFGLPHVFSYAQDWFLDQKMRDKAEYQRRSPKEKYITGGWF